MATQPPPPHDPRERGLLTRADGWEVRVFGEGDFRHAYFARKGMLHLQLWHPRLGISVLTPSEISGGRWELYSERTWKMRMPSRAALEYVLGRELAVGLPNPVTIAGLLFWFVEVPSGSSFDIEIRTSA